MERQRSCEKLVADPATSPELKVRLEQADALCRFAATELGLPAHGAYRRYADLGRPSVVWNVYAAPAFSLEAKTSQQPRPTLIRNRWLPYANHHGNAEIPTGRRLSGVDGGAGRDVRMTRGQVDGAVRRRPGGVAELEAPPSFGRWPTGNRPVS